MLNNEGGQGGTAAGTKRRGLMLILSSPSGAGKTTLTRELLAAEGEACTLSISATTRSPRPSEVEGQHYYFMERAVFEEKRQEGAFLEWAEVFGHLYGTPKAPVDEALSAGCDVIFDIDWQGARQLADNSPDDVVRVFILPPSRQALESRLRKRASDSDEVVARRLAGAAAEISHWSEYDYVIVNDDFAESLQQLRTILTAERMKRSRNLTLGVLVEDLLKAQCSGNSGN